MKNTNELKINNWYYRAKLAAEEELQLGERIFGIAIVVFCTLVILYFTAHQLLLTGFFTSNFSIIDMIFFYGFWVMWATTATLESILGLRLLSRLFDVFGGIIFAVIASMWLLIVFPFEFAYLANILPESIRFFVQWISNDVGRVIIVLLFIIHIIAAIYSPFAYKFVEMKPLNRKKKVD